MEKNPDEIGAKGEYMTGTINGQPVVLFRNDRKPEGSKQPDWRVLKSKPRETVQPTSNGFTDSSEWPDDPKF